MYVGQLEKLMFNWLVEICHVIQFMKMFVHLFFPGAKVKLLEISWCAKKWVEEISSHLFPVVKNIFVEATFDKLYYSFTSSRYKI